MPPLRSNRNSPSATKIQTEAVPPLWGIEDISGPESRGVENGNVGCLQNGATLSISAPSKAKSSSNPAATYPVARWPLTAVIAGCPQRKCPVRFTTGQVRKVESVRSRAPSAPILQRKRRCKQVRGQPAALIPDFRRCFRIAWDGTTHGADDHRKGSRPIRRPSHGPTVALTLAFPTFPVSATALGGEASK
jgi:hypothetical protein